MKILWLSSLDKDVMWNQNFYYERKAFEQEHDVYTYGPGFPDYGVEKDAQDIWKEHGPFDLVIHQEFFLYRFALAELDKLPCPKAAILCDAYANGIHMRQRIWKQGGVSIVLHRYPNLLDEWKKLCPNISFFHMPWAADPDVYKDYGHRTCDIALMGNRSSHLYPVRHRLEGELVRAGFDVLMKPHPGGIRHGLKLQRQPGSVLGEGYARCLASGLLGVATGGTPRFAVGKYFTIPACGTALLATDAEGLAELGFKHDENMFALDPLHSIAQITAILSDETRLTRVARAGYDFIRARHLWSHRVTAFTKWFEHALCN